MGVFLAACMVAMATADPKPLDVGGAYHEVEAHNIHPTHTGLNLGGTNGGDGISRERSECCRSGSTQQAEGSRE